MRDKLSEESLTSDVLVTLRDQHTGNAGSAGSCMSADNTCSAFNSKACDDGGKANENVTDVFQMKMMESINAFRDDVRLCVLSLDS